MSGPYPTMLLESSSGNKSSRTAVVTATHLNNKHANRTQKKEKDEAGLEIESVEENKKLKSKRIFEESATTKTKLAKELESPTQLESPTEESNNV